MSKVPSLPYTEIVKALERAGWTVTRQRGVIYAWKSIQKRGVAC